MNDSTETDNFVWKLHDHVFEAGKALVVLFVRIVPIYLALIAVFYTMLSADALPPKLVSSFRFVCITATIAMAVMLILFHYAVQKGLKLYCSISYDLCSPRHTSTIQKIEKRTRYIGVTLLVFGLSALSLILVALFDTIRV